MFFCESLIIHLSSLSSYLQSQSNVGCEKEAAIPFEYSVY